jgi:hypothetical protein
VGDNSVGGGWGCCSTMRQRWRWLLKVFYGLLYYLDGKWRVTNVRSSEAAGRSGGDDATERADAVYEALEVFFIIQIDGLKQFMFGDSEHIAASTDKCSDVLHLLERHCARVHLWTSARLQPVGCLAQNVAIFQPRPHLVNREFGGIRQLTEPRDGYSGAVCVKFLPSFRGQLRVHSEAAASRFYESHGFTRAGD